MFHEIIDFKKKTKISRTSNRKSLRNSIETCAIEQTGSEWPSTIFIPPWLNNIGLKLKNNHMYGAADNRTEKSHPDLKNQNQNDQNSCEERKQTVQKNNPNKSCHLEDSQNGYVEERPIQTSESYQKLPRQEKRNLHENNGVTQFPVIWRVKPKAEKMESSSTDSLMSSPNLGKKNLKMSELELSIGSPLENSRVSIGQKKKQRILKKKTRLREQTGSDRETFLEEIDADSLLEERAKAILENYGKKKIHSTASDIKRFEAKLMMLHNKIKLGKLSTEDSRFMEEVRTRAGSKENFDRLMQHVREVNLKDIIEGRNRILNSTQTKKDKEETKTHLKEENGTLLNTDDENEIKRFSEILRKSQNEEEKRKCLDEIRNYFERKRRTRLAKCWMLNTGSNKYGVKKKGKDANDNANGTGVKRRSKFSINDAELVSKAVDETLQKFVELYDFHVSPSLINCMKNNVLKDIQYHSSKHESSLINGEFCNMEGQKFTSQAQKNVTGKDLPEKKSLRDKNFKEETLPESEFEGVGGFDLEKEEMMRLKKELEYCINSARKDFTKLKVHSIIFKDDSQNSSGRNKEFVYGFLNHSLERKKSNLKGSLITTLKNIHVQVDSTSIGVNENTQTQKFSTATEEYIQTENKLQVSVCIQTEGTCAIELMKLNESDVTVGLYRMVKSQQAGKFYLYPENKEQPNNSPRQNKDSKINSVLEENFRGKILGKKTAELESEKKKVLCSEVLTKDVIRSVHADEKFFLPEKKECVWLWDGELINSCVDLKAHVETLLDEKLKEMSYGFLESLRSRSSRTFLTPNFSRARQSDSQDNLELKIMHSQLEFGNEDLEFGFQDDAQCFGEESAGTQSIGERINGTAETKYVRDASTQNSENRFFWFHGKKEKSSGKSRKSSKTVFLRRRQSKGTKKDRKSRRSILDLKRAMRMINECLFEKKIKYTVNESLRDSTCYSQSTPESSTSLYSKQGNDGRLTLVFGMEDNLSCKTAKGKTSIKEDEKSNSENSSRIRNTNGIGEPNHIMKKQVHWELIDKILHTVKHKERESLWNDLRELIKSKVGKDIDNEDAKEVCIQIEQKGKTKHSVLAKGYYVKKEGNVEVEIDLTLSDLETIIRRRERGRRKRSLNFRKYNRNLRLSSPATRSNVSSIQEFRNILRNVSR